MAKKKTNKPRNPAAIPAKTRKGGIHKPKSQKRQNNQNKQKKYIDENY